MGQDGQFVLLRHGGAYYRVHPCQIMKVIPSEDVRENMEGASSEQVKYDDKSVKCVRPWDREHLDWDSDGLRGAGNTDDTNENDGIGDVINGAESTEDVKDEPGDLNETDTTDYEPNSFEWFGSKA